MKKVVATIGLVFGIVTCAYAGGGPFGVGDFGYVKQGDTKITLTSQPCSFRSFVATMDNKVTKDHDRGCWTLGPGGQIDVYWRGDHDPQQFPHSAFIEGEVFKHLREMN